MAWLMPTSLYESVTGFLAGLPWTLDRTDFSSHYTDERIIEIIRTGSLWTAKKGEDHILHKKLPKASLRLLLRATPEAYLNSGEARDKEQRTPLMSAVARGDVDEVILFLQHNANPNLSDRKNKKALNYATAGGYERIIKALFIFGANSHHDPRDKYHPLRSLPKEDPYMPLEMAQANARIRSLFNVHEGIADGTDQTGMSIHSTLQQLKWRNAEGVQREHILCLDGGGMRGLVSLMILSYLQRMNHDVELAKCFTWIAGTSTGAIIAVALAQGRTPIECIRMYFQMKDDIFCGSKPYSGDKLEEFLRKELGGGEDNKMMSSLRGEDGEPEKKVLVTTVDATANPLKVHLFTSYSPVQLAAEKHRTDYTTEIDIARALRCSSAAPSYFPQVVQPLPDGRFALYLDGGLAANNPTKVMLREFEANSRNYQYGEEGVHYELGCVLSIGTGYFPPLNNAPIVLDRAKKLASLWSIMPFIELLIEKTTNSEENVPADRDAVRKHRHAEYFRFSPLLTQRMELDDTDNAKLIDMMWETTEYMFNNFMNVSNFAEYMTSCNRIH